MRGRRLSLGLFALTCVAGCRPDFGYTDDGLPDYVCQPNLIGFSGRTFGPTEGGLRVTVNVGGFDSHMSVTEYEVDGLTITGDRSGPNIEVRGVAAIEAIVHVTGRFVCILGGPDGPSGTDDHETYIDYRWAVASGSVWATGDDIAVHWPVIEEQSNYLEDP